MTHRRILLLAFVGMTLLPALQAQTIFNCPGPGWANAGALGPGANVCAIAVVGQPASNWALAGTNVSTIASSSILLQPTGSGHDVVSLIYQTPVNVQAFTENVRFIPNGQTISFALQNNNNPNVDGGASHLIGGAGGEAGIYQGFGTLPPSPNNLWAIVFDSYSPLTQSGSFTYSSAQMYQTLQPPFLPAGAENIAVYPTNKLSTSPVPLNSPATTQNTSTGDTYSATISYDGSTVTLTLFDVTAGGSCPGVSCFTQTWSNVSIPSIVGGTTAYVGVLTSTGIASSYPLTVTAVSYTVNTPTGSPTFTAWNANATYNIGTQSAASPVYSVAPGTHAGPQTVSLSTATSPNNYICYELATTTPTFYPQPDNNGACNKGTLYSSPLSISSTTTLYAMAGSNTGAFSASVSPTGLGPPSALVAGTYTITGGPAAAPTFSPVAGTYSGTQAVALSTTSSGAVICYNTTGAPATNGASSCTSGTLYTGPVAVSSTETLYAVAGGAGYTDSSVSSAAYTITAASQAAMTVGGKTILAGKAIIF